LLGKESQFVRRRVPDYEKCMKSAEPACLIHMERRAVGSMKPRRMRRGELPTSSSTFSPILLYFQC
jgi:hypothetical protein